MEQDQCWLLVASPVGEQIKNKFFPFISNLNEKFSISFHYFFFFLFSSVSCRLLSSHFARDKFDHNQAVEEIDKNNKGHGNSNIEQMMKFNRKNSSKIKMKEKKNYVSSEKEKINQNKNFHLNVTAGYDGDSDDDLFDDNVKNVVDESDVKKDNDNGNGIIKCDESTFSRCFLLLLGALCQQGRCFVSFCPIKSSISEVMKVTEYSRNGIKSASFFECSMLESPPLHIQSATQCQAILYLYPSQ